MSVPYRPPRYHDITPYLLVPDAGRLIEFLKQAFGAKPVEQMKTPDGRFMHAEVKIGDSMVMMGEPQAPNSPMPCFLYLYVADTDAVYRSALAAGGTSLMEPADQFYGDRNAGVRDPFGNMWWIATHKEDVAPEEMERRAQEAMKKRQASS